LTDAIGWVAAIGGLPGWCAAFYTVFRVLGIERHRQKPKSEGVQEICKKRGRTMAHEKRNYIDAEIAFAQVNA
jgi:hypothetical protein